MVLVSPFCDAEAEDEDETEDKGNIVLEENLLDTPMFMFAFEEPARELTEAVSEEVVVVVVVEVVPARVEVDPATVAHDDDEDEEEENILVVWPAVLIMKGLLLLLLANADADDALLLFPTLLYTCEDGVSFIVPSPVTCAGVLEEKSPVGHTPFVTVFPEVLPLL